MVRFAPLLVEGDDGDELVEIMSGEDVVLSLRSLAEATEDDPETVVQPQDTSGGHKKVATQLPDEPENRRDEGEEENSKNQEHGKSRCVGVWKMTLSSDI